MNAMTTPQTLHACLPMYDWPEVSHVWDALWSFVRGELGSAGIAAERDLRRPARLHEAWRDPAMILGQTCGWPYVSVLRGIVLPFARFDFALGGMPGDYHSVFVTAAGDDPGSLLADDAARIAANAPDSQSGFRAFAEIAEEPVALPQRRMVWTGSHRASIRAVAEGLADIAAIDAVSWRLAQLHEPAAQQVAVSGRSSPVPGLPLVTALPFGGAMPLLFDALSAGVESLRSADREALGLAGVVAAQDDDYRVLEEAPFGRISLVD